MEQIQRANRMYTNDSIFLKKSLSIPVLSDFGGAQSEDGSGCAAAESGHTGTPSEKKADDGQGKASDLSPMEFLKRLDGLINQSKQAAVGGRQEAEKRSANVPIQTVITTYLAISFTFIAIIDDCMKSLITLNASKANNRPHTFCTHFLPSTHFLLHSNKPLSC